MKEVTQDFIDNEEATQREPTELYHVWRNGGENWRYTDGDVAVDYDGETYDPATLERTSVQYNSTLDVSSVTVKSPALMNPTVDYIAQNPIEPLWIKILKLHRDDLTEADVIFIGQIKEVNFKGIKGQVQCVGFEHFLKLKIPRWRYQLNCNHIIFDSYCKVTKATYKVTTAITLTDTVELTASAFGGYADGYFIGGVVEFGDEARAIVAHEGNTITIMYSFIELVTTDTVDVYPGCDGRVETCRDKYSNINNFLGFPFIPLENPSTRVTW